VISISFIDIPRIQKLSFILIPKK